MIYDIILGTEEGQVCCPFHDDQKASAGVRDGMFHCFTCGAKASTEAGFISKYFNQTPNNAELILKRLTNMADHPYIKQSLTQEQIDYLHSRGYSDEVIKKYFFRSKANKLMFGHYMNGYMIGATWFNRPELPEYNVIEPKYKYNIIRAGLVSPYDNLKISKTVVVTEGESDMLTLLSQGWKNVVGKIGGAQTKIVGGIDWENKNVIIIYDCDEAGRQGAITDANYLANKFGCKVKVIDLGLPNKGDINDYFVKYKYTLNDLLQIIKQTPLYVPTVDSSYTGTSMQDLVDRLTTEQKEELKQLLMKQ